jgi:hypothetical protein
MYMRPWSRILLSTAHEKSAHAPHPTGKPPPRGSTGRSTCPTRPARVWKQRVMKLTDVPSRMVPISPKICRAISSLKESSGFCGGVTQPDTGQGSGAWSPPVAVPAPCFEQRHVRASDDQIYRTWTPWARGSPRMDHRAQRMAGSPGASQSLTGSAAGHPSPCRLSHCAGAPHSALPAWPRSLCSPFS